MRKSNFDFGHTCPIIDTNINIIEKEINHLVEDSDLANDLIYAILPHIENVRETNSSMREAAEDQLSAAIDEIAELKQTISDLEDQINDLEDRINDLNNELKES